MFVILFTKYSISFGPSDCAIPTNKTNPWSIDEKILLEIDTDALDTRCKTIFNRTYLMLDLGVDFSVEAVDFGVELESDLEFLVSDVLSSLLLATLSDDVLSSVCSEEG